MTARRPAGLRRWMAVATAAVLTVALVPQVTASGKSPGAHRAPLGPLARVAVGLARHGQHLPKSFAVPRHTPAGDTYGIFARGQTTAADIRSTGAVPGTILSVGATAYGSLDQLQALTTLPGVTEVDLAGRASKLLDQSVPATHAAEPGHASSASVPHLWSGTQGAGFVGDTGQGVIVGLVDTGIDIQDPDFMVGTATRIKSFWDQAASGSTLNPPTGFAYGRECSNTNIDNTNSGSGTGCGPFQYLAAVAGGDCNSPVQGGQATDALPEQDCDGHGTHVTGIAASNGRASGLTPAPGPFSNGTYSADGASAGAFIGMAPQADLVVVKSDFDLAHLVDGISYIFQRAVALGEPASVNLSLGIYNGPHDGTSIFETMLDALTGAGHLVSSAAGNEGTRGFGSDQVYYHASGQVPIAGVVSNTLVVQSQPVGFDIWYPSTDRLSINVGSPEGNTQYLYPDQAMNNVGEDGSCGGFFDGFMANNQDTVFITSCTGNGLRGTTGNGDNEIQVFIFNPTTPGGSPIGCSRSTPCVNAWHFDLYGASVVTGGFQAWAYSPGDYFIHDDCTGCPNLGNDSFTVAPPATAHNLLAVGSWVDRTSWPSQAGTETDVFGGFAGDLSVFSPFGPTRDGRVGIDLVAPGEVVGSSLSSHAATFIRRGCGVTAANGCIAQDGAHVFLQGTSMAAPHVAGAVALLLKQLPTLTIAEARRALGGAAFGQMEACPLRTADGGAPSLQSSASNPGCDAPNRQVGGGDLLLGPGAVDISPSSGPLTASTPVQICGVDFQTGMTVHLGSTDLTASLSTTTANGFCPIAHITVTVPPGTQPGTLPFLFQNPDGSSGTDVRGFTYTVPAATLFDFAEGFTGPGFHEYLTVENPDPNNTATLSFTYLETGGAVHIAAPTCGSVAPQRRCTEDVNADVGANQQVSAEVRSLPNGGLAVPVVVERPMYFSHDFGFGSVNGGHDAVGGTAGSTQRFFAEGYTGPGFQEYLTIENPNPVALGLQFTYLLGAETVAPQSPACETIAPFSRCTENVNLDIGAGHDVSTVITSTNGLRFFAERPMYFKHDFGFGLLDGGHDGAGTSHVTSAADFAEGFTGSGFQEYLTIENPNDVAITLSFAYAGESGPIARHISDCATVAAHSRCTVNVNADAGGNQQVSVHLSSSGGGFIAERPMYFNHDFGFGAISGGHDGLGVNAATNMVQDFAEGFTAPGFQEYLTVENPNSAALQLDIQYYGAAGLITRLTPTACASVAAHSRCTVNVDADINADATSGQAVAVHLDALNGVSFLAERPMYFAHVFGSDSVNGGHVSAGYSSAFS